MKNQDVECPYCGEWQEINHDDGAGYSEDELHQQECRDCDKTFTFTTSIIYSYDAEKAPCLNGGEHDLHQITGIPKEIFVGMKRCSYCDEEFNTTPEERRSAIESLNRLN